jgi:hypothetical protein
MMGFNFFIWITNVHRGPINRRWARSIGPYR